MRPLWSKKGDFGKILVVGGCDKYVGAPALAGLAAFAAGADVVKIAAPEKVAWAINCMSPDLITLKLEGKVVEKKHVRKILSESYDAMLVGNGIGTDKRTIAAVKELLKKGKNLVVDADAFKAKFIPKGAIITPHLGEFSLLFGKQPQTLAERKRDVLEMAHKHGCVILLKGHIDVISDGKRVATNSTGNPYMTTAGTGDTLAGVVAALRANHEPFDAAVLGAKINGMAGDRVLRKYGKVLASDIVREIAYLSP